MRGSFRVIAEFYWELPDLLYSCTQRSLDQILLWQQVGGCHLQFQWLNWASCLWLLPVTRIIFKRERVVLRISPSLPLQLYSSHAVFSKTGNHACSSLSLESQWSNLAGFLWQLLLVFHYLCRRWFASQSCCYMFSLDRFLVTSQCFIPLYMKEGLMVTLFLGHPLRIWRPVSGHHFLYVLLEGKLSIFGLCSYLVNLGCASWRLKASFSCSRIFTFVTRCGLLILTE